MPGKSLGLFASLDAYKVWENSPLVEPTERAQFLDDAVSGLAEDDRVICVRIALFCELFQGKPWDLKTLEKVGGVEGVGVLFMEETFADNAPAENRYHQKAVRAVLNALLPEPGSKIKGRTEVRARFDGSLSVRRRTRTTSNCSFVSSTRKPT